MLFRAGLGLNFGYPRRVRGRLLRKIIWVPMLLLLINNQAEGGVLSHLGEGNPGCFEVIRNRALSAHEVSSLPLACRHLHADYASLQEALLRDRPQAIGYIQKALLKSTLSQSPYEAILFSMLLSEKSLIPTLEKRAKIDQKIRVPFRYAALAVERLKGKTCLDLGSRYSSEFYQELCHVQDPLLASLGRRRFHR